MTSIVYFKFKANVKTDSVSFDGSSISVRDLKSAIRTKCCLYSTDFDLKLEDTTGKAYIKDDELIPKYSSIVVRRVPRITVEAPKKKTTAPEDLTWRDGQKNILALDPQQLNKHINLASSDLSEEEKIKIMMERSSEVYCESNFVIKAKPYGIPPTTYTCHKCNQPGHWIHNCPGVRDKTGKIMDVKLVKRPTGIPQDFLLEVEAGTPGAYLGKSGRYMVPIKDAEAYALGKKDKRPFSLEENPPFVPQERKPPKQFICPLCNKLFNDAVLVSCCGTTYCNDCIMGHVFDSQVLGSHKCPNCNATLTDHESSVFENALVRSLIRDWLIDETKISDNLTSQDLLPEQNELEKTLNYRRVLKPRQAMNNYNFAVKHMVQNSDPIQSTEEAKTGSRREQETEPENENFRLPHVSISNLSKTNSVTLSNTISTLSPKIDSVHVSQMNVSHNSVVTHNTISSVVTSPSSTTLVEVNRPVISNTQVPRLSYPNSTTVMPSMLQNINGGSNSLLNVYYNMQLDNLQHPNVNPSSVLPVSYPGSLVGAPEWVTEPALAAQGTSLVNPILQVNNNQNAFGLVSGSLHSGLMVPIETLDGHKMLSKEEFYRLKMEVLHSSLRRHRHRSRSRSPVHSNRSHVDSIRHRYGLNRSLKKRLYHHPSIDNDCKYIHQRQPDQLHREKYDRSRGRLINVDVSDDRKRYYGLEFTHSPERHLKHSSERSPHMGCFNYKYEYESISPNLGDAKNDLRNYIASHPAEAKYVDARLLLKRHSPISVVPQYDESDSDSIGPRNPSVPREVNCKPHRREFHDRERLNSPNLCHVSLSNWTTEFLDPSIQSFDRRIVLTKELPTNYSPNNHDLRCVTKLKNKKEKKHKKHKHRKHSERMGNTNEENPDSTEELSWVSNDEGSFHSNSGKVKREKKHKKHRKHKRGSKKKSNVNPDFIPGQLVNLDVDIGNESDCRVLTFKSGPNV